MYFFSNEEKEKLTGFFLPKSREMQVSEDLRGWNWTRPPLEPMYDINLTISEVSSRYCPNGRDLFLRRVAGLKLPPNEVMVSGNFFHSILSDFVIISKKSIFVFGNNLNSLTKELQSTIPLILERNLKKVESPFLRKTLEEKGRAILDYELRSLCYRFQETISRQPNIGADSLVFQVLPVVVEQKVDGSRLGLSPFLSCDAFYSFEPVIIDLKFGSKRDFHILGPAGYALVFESLFSFPVNLCCLVYVSFLQDQLKIEKEFHLISDEVRMRFIEERDEKMRMVYEEIDPGVPNECSRYCQYLSQCQPGRIFEDR
ncbi:MAG: type I-A CRISPR-associated protein Cas4/Csa1 [Caldiserica bacterium]|jgi:CRISPR-associated protein Csa1|nr:type I-A CRISPR-associated protein Cas4/Csa1 [Caldisericota bacterium]MDH7562829.1 type I-A CRISPR-associated protein Cas4/Csa1 [Caldisericota bacterium]